MTAAGRPRKRDLYWGAVVPLALGLVLAEIHAGAVWRFNNEGNRAAFAADPDVYMPRYGGYDPVGISRGHATPGFPALWVVFYARLYLFYTADTRAAFGANPTSVIASAS